MPGYNAENPDVKEPYAVSTLGDMIWKIPSTHEGPIPKPAMEGATSPANLEALQTPVEKSHMGVGPGWSTRRPKAGA